ncbi:MAG: hypothetical protein JW955_11810 [Sedimentisphaerales bacterium]|nr:hypothetical protein [Sedimentisphaerales bacterium]
MGNRFVVQQHTTADGVHWDLMIEKGRVLLTFRLAEPPENAVHGTIRAIRIFDHALRFLTYEGPVQKGAGHVRIVDRGDCHAFDEREDAISMELHGVVLWGPFALLRIDQAQWQLTARPPGS